MSMSEFIFDLQRFSYFYNRNADSLVSGTSGGDIIDNDGENSTINTGAGNDEIDNKGDYSVVNSGEDNDTITNGAQHSTLNGGSGNDYITNNVSNVSIFGGSGNDTINNGMDKVTIDGGAGNDSILNSGDNNFINGGAGSDTIYDWRYHNTISGGAGNDYVESDQFNSGVYVYGGGNDTIGGFGIEGDSFIVIENYKWEHILPGYSDGSDNVHVVNVLDDNGSVVGTIKQSAWQRTLHIVSSLDEIPQVNRIDIPLEDNQFIKGTSGKDYITGYFFDPSFMNITIDAGAGDDHISSDDVTVSINGGAGNDTVFLWYNKRATVDGGDGDDVVDNWSNGNVTFRGGLGNDTIYAADNTLIQYKNGDGNDYITGFGDNTKISISGAPYSIERTGPDNFDDVIISVGEGKITLEGVAYRNFFNIIGTLEGGGIDTTPADTTPADTTPADTSILIVTDSTSSPVTITSAVRTVDASTRTKAVKITGNANANSIVGGSGKNSIYGGAGADALVGGSGNDKLFGEAGNDSIVGGDGADTLSGGAGADKLFGENGNDSMAGGEGADILSGGAGNDKLLGGAGNDSLNGGAGNDTLNGGAGNDTLIGGAGADIFIYTAGKDVIQDYSEEDKISIAGTAQIATSGNDVIFNGKITVKNAADKVITYIDKGGEQIYPQANDDVEISGKTITLLESYMEDAFDLTDYDTSLQTVDASAVQHDLSITGNKLANSILGSGQNDTLDGGAGNDKLTGGAGADTFVLSAGKDSIFDYNEDDDIIQFGAKAPTISTSGKNVIFKLSNTQTVTVIKGVGKTIRYTVDGVEKTYPETVKFNAKGTGATLTAAYTKDTFDINDYGDYAGSVKTINAAQVVHDLTITANKLANRIVGSDENDYIDGGAAKDTILAGDGNDTIYGGKGNDSLQGGDGSDVFIYTTGDGNDIITDYAEEDRISIVGTAKTSTSGNNVILTVGSGKITVRGAADKIVTYVDSTGTNYYPNAPEPITVDGKGVTIRANYEAASYTATSSIVTIDASQVNHDLRIMGNGKANDILGGSGNDSLNGGAKADTLDGGSGDDILLGGSGNDMIFGGEGDDTITGGAGNDELWGGEGSDEFIYRKGDGKDVIYNFSDEDSLTFNNLTFTTSYKNDALIFKVGTTANAVTLKEFTATTFNINGDSYQFNGTTLVRS